MKVILICFLLIGFGFSAGFIVLFGWYLLGKLTGKAEKAVWARMEKGRKGDDLRQVVKTNDARVKPVKL